MSGKLETKKLIADLQEQGFEVTITPGGHYKVTKPGEKGCQFLSYTPSDHRAVKNALARLRRWGFDDKPRHRKGKKRK